MDEERYRAIGRKYVHDTALTRLGEIEDILAQATQQCAELRSYLLRMNEARNNPTTFDAPLSTLNLNARTYGALLRGGFETVGQVMGAPDDALLEIRLMGQRNVDEVRAAVCAFCDRHGGLDAFMGDHHPAYRSRT